MHDYREMGVVRGNVGSCLLIVAMSTRSQSKSDSDVAKIEAIIPSIRNLEPNPKKTLADRFENVARKSDFVVLIVILITGLGYVTVAANPF